MQHNNLNTFSILFLIKGILTLLFSVLFIFYILFGYFLDSFVEQQSPDEMIVSPGSVFLVIGIVGFVIVLAFGILTLYASKYLKKQTRYNFIFAIAVINCLTGILGILLGVFTLIELSKPEVKALFFKENEQNSPKTYS